jgi:hypothetical protein
MHSASQKRATLLLAVISVVISCTAAESYVRLFLFERVDTAFLRARLAETEIHTFAEPVADPELYFALKPNLDIRFGGSRLRTGPDAYRIPSRPRAFSPHAARVAVLGDSSAFGWRVNYEQSYPELFRQHLEESLGVDIELRNYSVPAYNSQQEIRLFHTRVAEFDPDLLILHHDLNDSLPRDEITKNVPLPPEYGDNALHSSLLKLVLRSIAAARERRHQRFDDAEHSYVEQYIASGPLHAAHLDALERFAVELHKRKLPTIAVLFYAFPEANRDFERDPIYADLLKPLSVKMSAMGYHVLDLYPAYQQMMRDRDLQDLRSLWISPTDAHPNARGHRFIARQLARLTEQQPDIIAPLQLPR